MWILNFYGIICCWVLFFNFSFDLFSSLSIFYASLACRSIDLVYLEERVLWVTQTQIFFLLRSRNLVHIVAVIAAHCPCSRRDSVCDEYINTKKKTCVKYCLQLLWFVHLGFWVSYTRHQTVPLNYIFFLVWVIKSDGVWNSMVRKTFAVTFTVASLNLFTICIAFEISISSFFSSLFRIVNIKWQMQSENAL